MCRETEKYTRSAVPNCQIAVYRTSTTSGEAGKRYKVSRKIRVMTSSCPREFVNYKRGQAVIIAKHRHPNKVHCGTLGLGIQGGGEVVILTERS